MGLTKAMVLVFVIILYLDYIRALILLANLKAHLLLGLSLPFSAIPPAAAGVVPRLRESQTNRSPAAASARSPPPPSSATTASRTSS